MQDGQPINGVINGSRVFLKRITRQQPPQQSSLKCPRCESLNTKFCYYNNYNLSQPRHFCKNCRRYWTKGGVLRNIPVGGGCRKSKRSSSSSSSSSSKHNKSSSSTTIKNAQNSHSSSDSSSATAVVGGDRLFQIPDVENFGMSSDLFSGQIEGFMGLITDNNNNNNNINTVAVDETNANVSTASFSEFLQSQEVQEWDMGKIFGGVHQGEEKIGSAINLIDPTVTIEDLLQNRGSNVDLASLDWHHEGSMSDVADHSSTVDNHHQGCYWDQSTVDNHHDSQWSDFTTSHLPLFLP